MSSDLSEASNVMVEEARERSGAAGREREKERTSLTSLNRGDGGSLRLPRCQVGGENAGGEEDEDPDRR